MATSTSAVDRAPGKSADVRLVLTLVAAGAVLGLDAVTPAGLAVWLLQVVVIWITTLWAGRRQIIFVASLGSLFIVLGAWLSSRAGIEDWVVILNVLLSVGAAWAIAQTSLRQKTAEEARKRAAEELAKSQETVAVLTGILPICASCKKIRNEAGAWEQLEAYITNHSQAQFSHGICGPCMVRLYPEFIEQSSQQDRAS